MLNNDFKNKKVVFAGCARDCEKYLEKILSNINYYTSLFEKSYQIIVENGSKDRTREILKSKKNPNCYYLFDDNLDQYKTRGERLERARNKIIEKIKSEPDLRNCDLLVILDCDDTGEYRINNENISKSLEFLFSKKNIAGIFANQLGTYYDMWALRDEKYCKNDFWAEILQNICAKLYPIDQTSPKILEEVNDNYIKKKTYSFNINQDPINVYSAFGGFGIYKMENVLNNKRLYEGTQTIDLKFKDNTTTKVKFQKCEHVNFNFGFIDQNCELYILPYLINRDFIDITFHPQVAIKFIIKN